ncbi:MULTISPECIES: DUF4190 domain-containing protein [unclassified Streptomyces]|uniref:DUF4190 domain-containing protein n=1 Tax=unclassified Streptomyces TaxID=2593676 RepID=UPI001F0EFFE8|nr:DUF4190 domain-containing protein [Streptomyces sp. A1136]
MSVRSTVDRILDTERTDRAEHTHHTERTDRAAGAGRPRPVRDRTRDADGMAVASFLLGLVGLLAMNLLLGPASMVLAVLALRRGTSRPGRARLGFALGVADLVVLACLVGADHTWSWGVG